MIDPFYLVLSETDEIHPLRYVWEFDTAVMIQEYTYRYKYVSTVFMLNNLISLIHLCFVCHFFVKLLNHHTVQKLLRENKIKLIEITSCDTLEQGTNCTNAHVGPCRSDQIRSDLICPVCYTECCMLV